MENEEKNSQILPIRTNQGDEKTGVGSPQGKWPNLEINILR